jgi:hypothetical protein
VTDIQIKYWSQREEARHNLAYETETYRHNVESERLTQQSNKIDQQKADEIERHNRAMERLEKTKVKTAKGQLALDKAKAKEVARHNVALEKLEQQSNAIKAKQAAVSAISAQASMKSAEASLYDATVNKSKQAQASLMQAIANAKVARAQVNQLNSVAELNKARTPGAKAESTVKQRTQEAEIYNKGITYTTDADYYEAEKIAGLAGKALGIASGLVAVGPK